MEIKISRKELNKQKDNFTFPDLKDLQITQEQALQTIKLLLGVTKQSTFYKEDNK